MKQQNLVYKARTRKIADLTIDLSNKIYQDVITKLEAVADSDNLFYIKTLESIDDEPETFKSFIYFALKELFNCREIDLLTNSSTDSRNFLIAYKKLSKFYKKSLSDRERESLTMSYGEMVATIFDYLSADYVEMVNPELEEDTKNNNINPKKVYQDYNEICELFV